MSAAIERAGTLVPGDPELRTPIVANVLLECPNCQAQTMIAATFRTRLVRDHDGTGSLALRTKAAKVEHVCGQPTLGLLEGPRDR